MHLDLKGYVEATEFSVIDSGLNRHKGILFTAAEYPETVFEAYWDGEKIQFRQVEGYILEDAGLGGR